MRSKEKGVGGCAIVPHRVHLNDLITRVKPLCLSSPSLLQYVVVQAGEEHVPGG